MPQITSIDIDIENAINWLRQQKLNDILQCAGWTEQDAVDIIIEGLDDTQILKAYLDNQIELLFKSEDNIQEEHNNGK